MSESHDASAVSVGSEDPLKGLYRMSTTAGLGSTEYVAINPLAVTAIVLGLLSAIVLLGWPLLIVPIAAVIFAIVALRQIRNSNGTQTGSGLAWGGIVLGVAFVALVGTRQVTARMEASAAQEQISVMAAELGNRLGKRDWQGAYGLFSPQFQQLWPPAQFVDRMEQVLATETLGALRSASAGARVHIEDYAAGRRGIGNIHFTFEKRGEPATLGIEYILVGDQWRINDIPALFQQQEQQ